MVDTRSPGPCSSILKKAHADVIPGMQEYIAEFMSEKAMGDDGYLSDRGLIPLPIDERKQVARAVNAMQPLKI